MGLASAQGGGGVEVGEGAWEVGGLGNESMSIEASIAGVGISFSESRIGS